MTLRLSANPNDILRAAKIIREGGLVAFPTETVYGLGANALSADAVAGIFRAKNRPPDNPLIVHVDSTGNARCLCEEIPEGFEELARRFWPGPLTFVLKRSPDVPAIVSAGLDTLAVRVPSHPVALSLVKAAGVPVAAPSANASGRPSPTTAAHVIEDLDGRIDAIIDGGSSEVGVESTVLDLTARPFRILRAGGVSSEELATVLGYEPSTAGDAATNSSPGVRHVHYRPRCTVRLFSGFPPTPGKRDGFVTLSLPAPHALLSRRMKSLEEYARELYAIFREAERREVEVLHLEKPPCLGLGAALLDRLARAAAGD